VVTLNWPLAAPAPEDMRWVLVEEPSATAACRGAALSLAGRLRFPAIRTDELALAVTEAASNLHKHARQGSLLLRISRDGGAPGVELVTIDVGPGLSDANAALRDGHSTSGTLGIGLGAIRRMGHTRGGAIGVVQVDGQVARFAGLGNITATLLTDGGRRNMLSVPGIAGHQARTIRQFEYEVAPGTAVILHSDGISSRWNAAMLPGLASRDPLVIAAAVLAEAGTHRDDAGILVLKP
jgi:anti-sigma regulatory factor (Ser/Thr protein kinase)